VSTRLKVEGLTVDLAGRRVVDALDLEVGPGEIVGLLGPNGAGKTTAFRGILGLIPTTTGRVTLGGVDLGGLPLWRRVRAGLGYLPQSSAVFRRLSVAQNLAMAVEAAGGGDVGSLLEGAGLVAVKDTLAGALSGGERRRLDMARCRATGAKVLLLDEPFAAVDPQGVAEL